ncbi:MAG TPA: carboxypeptidase regulatory-like domain-containing protein [Patescibacteria group bacterium]|nr:carboxypeptidase regulatory-like domain-containing protein [Patescibacteria group bacterium]
MGTLSRKAFWLAVALLSAAPLAMGATITGTVKGPDGKPFEGAFVEARNTATNISTDVLSHENGGYMAPNLPAGSYVLTIWAPGYKASPRNETLQSADQHARIDFALQKGTVTWADISGWQATQLFPPGPGREVLFGKCFACHEFQHRWVIHRGINYQGWLGLVNFMRNVAMPYFLPPSRFTNQMTNQAATYLTQLFGPNSSLPASPAELAGYQATVRKFSPEAMNIVYVVYPVAGNWVNDKWVMNPLIMTSQMYPPTAGMGYPSDGSIWVAEHGNANRVVRINPTTGKMTTYAVPPDVKNLPPCEANGIREEVDGIHAIEAGPDGKAWFAETGCDRVGSVDPKTGNVTQYAGSSAHDAHPMLVDGKLYVFASAGNTRLDPQTGKFTHIPGVPVSYEVIEDKVNGNLWFTELGFGKGGAGLYEVDPKTLKIVMKFAPPAGTAPAGFSTHRTGIASNGILWLTCYRRAHQLWPALSTRVCRFDPKTKALKVYTPLGPAKYDYAIAVGKGGYVWYSMVKLGTIQRLDPRTGHIIEYPEPFTEPHTLRYWPDSQGRIWTVSQNNVVFYWYLANSNHMRAAK